jgi:hypothetical protein
MKSLAVFILLFLFASCTITKRLHNPGWHVEWKTSVNKSQAQDNSSTSASSVDQRIENSAAATPDNSQTMNVVEVEKANETSIDEDRSTNDVLIDENQNLEIKKGSPESADQKQTSVLNSTAPRADPLGILSIISGSTALIFFLNICFLLSDNGWNAIFGLSYPWLFFIVLSLAVIGLILAIISLKRIRQNPELYKGKKTAWTGFGISAASGGLVLVTLLLIALYFIFEFLSW